MNQVTLQGNIGMDPELKDAGGTPCLRLRVATNENYKKNGEWVEKVEWHTVIVWGEQGARLGAQLQKGHSVLVQGSLETRSWEQDGAKKYSTEIKAYKVKSLERRAPTRDSDGGEDF
jgi:single-strand DNA-binding protein